jgi:hypothetical protein
MQHTTKRKRGKPGCRWSMAGSVTDAAKLAGKDRATMHRWIKRGLICKCDKDGVYCPQGRFIWLQDVYEFLVRVAPRSGKVLNPDAVKRPFWKRRLHPPFHASRSRVDVAVRRLVSDTRTAARRTISPAQAAEYLASLEPALNKLQKIAGIKTNQ